MEIQNYSSYCSDRARRAERLALRRFLWNTVEGIGTIYITTRSELTCRTIGLRVQLESSPVGRGRRLLYFRIYGRSYTEKLYTNQQLNNHLVNVSYSHL